MDETSYEVLKIVQDSGWVYDESVIQTSAWLFNNSSHRAANNNTNENN